MAGFEVDPADLRRAARGYRATTEDLRRSRRWLDTAVADTGATESNQLVQGTLDLVDKAVKGYADDLAGVARALDQDAVRYERTFRTINADFRKAAGEL